MAGSLPAVLALVLSPVASASAATQPMTPEPRTVPTRAIAVTTLTKVEQVRYRNGKTDKRPPFSPLVAGESAFVRVRVLTGATRLPAGVVRLRLEFESALAGATVRMVERDGVRRCVRVDQTIVSCLVDRVPAEDEASMLVKVEIPAGVEPTEVWFRGTVAPIGDLVVTAPPTYARLAFVGLGPWSGTWHWYATWDTGAWDGDGMRIYQPRDDRERVVCATWPWAGGGAAWGAVNAKGVWQGVWRDGFGDGTWELELLGDSRFTGTQVVDVHGGPDFTATITGQRTSEAVPVLDCDAVRRQALG